MSVSALSQHHVKLRKQGVIRIIAPAVRYRDHHNWHLEQAACYRTGLKLAEDNELLPLLRHGIAIVMADHEPRMRNKLAKAAQAWDGKGTEVDTDGPEDPGPVEFRRPRRWL